MSPPPASRKKRLTPTPETANKKRKVTVYACPACKEVKVSGRSLRDHLLKVHDVESSKFKSLQKIMEKKVRVKVEELPVSEVPAIDVSGSAPRVKRRARAKKLLTPPLLSDAMSAPRVKRRARAKKLLTPPILSDAMNRLYYNCKICFQAYVEGEELEFHIKSDHPEELMSELKHSDVQASTVCCRCLKEFSTKATMTRHYVHHHLGYKPYSCKMCEQRTTERRNMVKHLDICHQMVNNNQEGVKGMLFDHNPKPDNYFVMDSPIPKSLYFIA